MLGSDDEAPIDVKPKAERVVPPSPQPIPENMERVYDSEEEYYFLRPKPKDNIKDIIKTKPAAKANPPTKPKDGPEAMLRHNIYSKIRFICEKFNEEFRNKTALTTHRYSHNCKYLENAEVFDINSSQNMREFYITDKAGNYIEDIDDAVNISLDEITNCYEFRKFKSFKHKITAECDYKKRTKDEVKITKIFFVTDYIINNAIYEKRRLHTMAKL